METFMLPLTKRGIVRLSVPLRETYLTAAVDGATAMTQAVGDAVRIWIASANEDIRLDLQTTEWIATKPYAKSIRRWGVNINRYVDALVVDRSGAKPQIEARVTPVEVCYE